jgi:hypothetical protein
LNDTVRVHAIDEVVFCAKDVSSSDIISFMSSVSDGSLEFKIAPPESLYIIGSNSIETSGDVFILDVNSVSKKENRRSKRWFDFAACLVLLPVFPLVVVLQKKPVGFCSNWLSVLIGKKTWVGYNLQGHSAAQLPSLRPSVIHTNSHLAHSRLAPEQVLKLNILYAKDYRLSNDVRMLLRSYREWGS